MCLVYRITKYKKKWTWKTPHPEVQHDVCIIQLQHRLIHGLTHVEKSHTIHI